MIIIKGAVELTSEKQRIMDILSELVHNSLNAGSSDININIKTTSEKVELTIQDNGRGMDEETLAEARHVLGQARRRIYDEYYSGLGGTQHADSGLNLIGFQVDETDIQSGPEGTTIKVRRKH